jgi:hypothetical protein
MQSQSSPTGFSLASGTTLKNTAMNSFSYLLIYSRVLLTSPKGGVEFAESMTLEDAPVSLYTIRGTEAILALLDINPTSGQTVGETVTIPQSGEMLGGRATAVGLHCLLRLCCASACDWTLGGSLWPRLAAERMHRQKILSGEDVWNFRSGHR